MITFVEWAGMMYLIGIIYALGQLRTDLSLAKRFVVALLWPVWIWREDGI